MRSTLFISIAALALASTAHAGPSPKAEVCHWTAAGSYNLLNVSVTSAHFDPSMHPNDVLPVNGVCGATSTDYDGLFGLLDNDIVEIDTSTGAAAPFLSPALSTDVYHLTWNPNTSEFYVLENAYSAPRLVAIDPCTGTVNSDVALTVPDGDVFFCEGLDYDRFNDRLVATCSLDGTIAQQDLLSESIVEVNTNTGALSVLYTNPPTVDGEYDLLVFVGSDARALDGQGTLFSNRWYSINNGNWGSNTIEKADNTPYGVVAWDWDNGGLYTVNNTTTTHPYTAGNLSVQDDVTRALITDIGPTGLSAMYPGASNPRGLTFADFTCSN